MCRFRRVQKPHRSRRCRIRFSGFGLHLRSIRLGGGHWRWIVEVIPRECRPGSLFSVETETGNSRTSGGHRGSMGPPRGPRRRCGSSVCQPATTASVAASPRESCCTMFATPRPGPRTQSSPHTTIAEQGRRRCRVFRSNPVIRSFSPSVPESLTGHAATTIRMTLDPVMRRQNGQATFIHSNCDWRLRNSSHYYPAGSGPDTARWFGGGAAYRADRCPGPGRIERDTTPGSAVSPLLARAPAASAAAPVCGLELG